MKKLRYALLALILTLSYCKPNNNKKQASLNQETKKYNMSTKKIYYLDYSIPGIVYADFYINDIKIGNAAEGNGYEELNPYMLNSGENTIRLRMYKTGGESWIEPYHINQKPKELPPLRVKIYTSDENEENIESVIEFKNPTIESPVPVYEASWKFEAELPYELEGWRNAQDLTKLNKEELEKRVVSKFKILRKQLNSGNIKEFYQSQSFSLNEEVISMYVDSATQNEWQNDLHDIFNDQKNRMLPIENYKMKFYGDGRLVTLERTDLDKKLHGFCVLISKYEKTYHNSNKKYLGQDLHRVYLMLPKNETEFKIARYYNYIN
ncbi:hypothetical protein ACSTS3_10680 [Aquimarina muelleri]|uniref:hypothetical protein n=1 Tax=Aquimarina muelleri TaxID=279356 RepID=UPI003F68945C